MSIEQNPLLQFNSYTTSNILVAFKYTEDAESTKISPSIGNSGDVVDCKQGPAIVIFNEFATSDFNLRAAKWSWDFFSPKSISTSSCVGYLELTDRTGLHFVDFLKNKVSAKLGLSEGHIVFALRTFFIGNTGEIIVGSPLIFNMTNLSITTNKKNGNFYAISFIGAHNTLSQLNQYCKLYQTTITHKDGNIGNSYPQMVTVPKDATRKEQDKLLLSKYKDIQDKSKPMKTLKDVFDSFAVELNNQKYTHNSQLQFWLSQIDEDYKNKIIPPTQKKIGQIPIDYSIILDPVYYDYEIDNRNLPFEQTEIAQNKNGIRSLTFKNGTTITSAIEQIMKLSQKVGIDAGKEPGLIFKVCSSVIRNNKDRYEIIIRIKRITVPKNTEENVNTGPDKNTESLEFFVHTDDNRDSDVIQFDTRITSDVGADTLEQETDMAASKVIYGDREQLSMERIAEVPFFDTQFSGLRTITNPYYNFGLESASNAAKIDNILNLETIQSSYYRIVIIGNPDLLSDLNRKPSDVANGTTGSARFYEQPEFDPMYATVKIFLRPNSVIGLEDNEELPEQFYFKNYVHLYKVTNILNSGTFYQQLEMLKTDETV